MESKRIEYRDRIEWRNEQGQLHRLDGPAREWGDGSKEWWVNGKSHREDGPALEDTEDGNKYWWLNGRSYSEEEWKEEMVKLKLNRIKDL